MAQWREHLPHTSVARVRFLDMASCGLSLRLVLILALRDSIMQHPSFNKTSSLQIKSLMIPQELWCQPQDYLQLNTGVAPTCDWKLKIALVRLLSSRDL